MRSGCGAGVIAVLLICGSSTQAVRSQSSAAQTPQQAVDELLAADRGFSKASAQTDVVSGLSAMFAPDVIMPVPGGQFARGAEAATAALRGNAANLTSHAEWTPVRGGISADGRHGFTFGYMTTRQADGTAIPAKYLSYWVKQSDGWRVAAYKRSRATAEKPASLEMMPPSLPAHMVPVSTDAAALERHRQSLDAAERAFSAEAQKIDIGPAFVKFGSADAVNAGPPTQATYIVGSEAIGRSIGSGYGDATGSPVSWAPDVAVLVASSGDLGVTVGLIRANKPGPDGNPPPPIPFFTIWRRATPNDPWRYIAE
jgi:ketosteroid isomerase-like protein